MEHDPLEVITGELSTLTEEVIRQRRETEKLAENAEIRLRQMELHLDRPWKDKAWTVFVATMLVTGVLSVAAVIIMGLWHLVS